MTVRKVGLPLACLAMLSACVSNPANITAAYINHAQYTSLPCDEVQAELQRVSAREADLTTRQGHNFAADTFLLTAGLVVFWPALLLMPLTTDRKPEIAQMRGEKEALERAAVRQCSTRMAQPATAATRLANMPATTGDAPGDLQATGPMRFTAAPAHGADARRRLLVRVDPASRSEAGPSDLRTGPGLIVLQVLPGGVGSAAGLQPGDAIVALDGIPVVSVEDMQRMLGTVKANSVVVASVRRDGQERPTPLHF